MNPLLGITSVLAPPKINVSADSWLDITPGISTYNDIKTFSDNPTLFNGAMAAWGGASDALLLSGLGSYAGAALKSSKAAFSAWLRSLGRKEVRRGALRRLRNTIKRELSTVVDSGKQSVNTVAKGTKYSVALELFEGVAGPTFNDNLPPLWKTYAQQ